MTLSPQWLDELRSRTTLSTLIGKSLKITKKGREFSGCCPFHHEKRPASPSTTTRAFIIASAAARTAMQSAG
jgi:DNA primase